MSRDAKVDLDFADGTYTFRLAWGQLIELQEKCDAGPYVVLERLDGSGWLMQDIGEVIRLGLIGGGLEPAKAVKLVRRYVEDRPPMESVMLARGILAVALMGAPDEPVGEPLAADQESHSTTSREESSDSPPSTVLGPT
jgi:hypothetical protein